MSFVAQSNLSSMTLGKLLKILSKGAVYNQLPSAAPFWEQVNRVLKADDAKGREYRYEVLMGYGPAAVQATGYSNSAAFPQGQRAAILEAIGQYKDFDMTLEYDLTLEDKSGAELISYARPLALELQAKGIVAARIASGGWFFGDGSGAIGVVSSVTVSTGGDYIDILLNVASSVAGRSHPGWFEQDDKVKFATAAGVAHNTINNAGTTVAYWQVVSANQDTDVIRLQPYDSNGSLIDINTATLGATDPTAADLIYRKDVTPNDLTAVSTNDWNSVSQVMVGMESLSAEDGRTVNGIPMSGITAGTIVDGEGALLSSKLFQKVLSKGKRRTSGMSDGKPLSYSKAWMHDRDYDVTVEAAEANRQFFNVQDPNSGVSRTGHRHNKQFVEFMASEFVPFQRIYILPDQKGPLEFAGRDFKEVKLGGTSEFLKPTSDGKYYKQAQKFMSGAGVLMAKHPAALLRIENFALAE